MGLFKRILNEYYDSIKEQEQFFHGVSLTVLNQIAIEARGISVKLGTEDDLVLCRKSNRNKPMYIHVYIQNGKLYHRAQTFQGYPDHVADSFVAIANKRCHFT